MPLRNHKQVMDGLDSLAERRVERIGAAYRKGLTRPLLEALRSAGGEWAALRSLGPGLVKRMDDTPLAADIAEALDQAAGIGTVSATPRENAHAV